MLNTFWMNTVSSYLLTLLKAKNSLNVCLVLASCLILSTQSSTISSLSSDNYLLFSHSVINSYITFLGESLSMKCLAFRVLPLSRLAIANKQLSLSLITSACEVIFYDYINSF